MNTFYTRNVLKHGIFDLIDKNDVFEKDNMYFTQMRESINTFIKNTMSLHSNKKILEIGPSTNKERRLCSELNEIETVDIVHGNDTTYVADLTKQNELPKEHFDVIYCLEVLEHTYEPWEMIKQLYELLKRDGVLYVSVPFQFRVHGPLPDCYRISEYGLKYLFEKYNFEILQFDALIDSSRPAFPLHYTLECKKKNKNNF